MNGPFGNTSGCVLSGPGGVNVGVGVGGGGGHGGGGQGGTAASGPGFDYRWVVACSTNSVDTSITTCPGALASCGTPGEARFWVYRRPVDAAGQPTGPWVRLPGSLCRPLDTTGAPVLAAADIAAAFRWEFVPIAASRVSTSPSSGTLVNVDTIFFADTPATTTTAVTLLGQRVTLTLHPTRWRWDFGDGHIATTTTPGAAYPSHDVTHRYTDTGTFAATVSVTWDGTFTFAGETVDIPGDTSRAGPPSSVVVSEAHAHLVGG